jgi:hypothetical protein
MLDLKQGALYGMSQAQGGDTLSKIAKTFYGDPKAYPKIFDINKDPLQNPDQIKVGRIEAAEPRRLGPRSLARPERLAAVLTATFFIRAWCGLRRLPWAALLAAHRSAIFRSR